MLSYLMKVGTMGFNKVLVTDKSLVASFYRWMGTAPKTKYLLTSITS